MIFSTFQLFQFYSFAMYTCVESLFVPTTSIEQGRGPARVQLYKEVKHQTEAVPYPFKNRIFYYASIISRSVSFLTH